jgi:DNA-binding beta-propeller fold protein YncE
MFRMKSRGGRGGRRRLWLAVATALALLGAAAPAQAAPFVYVTHLADDVSQYNVGAGGLLAPLVPPTVAAGDQPGGVAVSPDGKSVYVPTGDGQWPPSATISQYDVGPGGTLSPKSPPTVAAEATAGSVAVSPDGKSVYVANFGSPDVDPQLPSSISQYDVGPEGALSPKSPATVGGGTGLCMPDEIAVSPDGKSVYVTGADNYCISQWDVGPGGRLSPKSPPRVETESIVSGVAVSPDSKSVYVTGADGYAISQWNVGPGGALSPKSPATVPGVFSASPSGIAVSPDGKSVYARCSFVGSGGGLCQFDVGPDGALSPKSPPAVSGHGYGRGLVVSPDGHSVYVANADRDNVSQYNVGAGGELSPKSPATVASGDWPTHLAVGAAARVPTTKRQCKHGGWKQLGFKSQGRCIRFVKRGSRK